MILLYLIPGFFILYWFYLLHVFDFIASGLALLSIHFSKERNRIMDYNLRLCLPGKTKKEYDKVKYLSMKMLYMNVLFVFTQRVLLLNDRIITYLPNKDFDNQMFLNKDGKRICVFCHYGIFSHTVTFKNLYGPISFMYKNHSKTIHKLIYNIDDFAPKGVFPYLHTEMSLFKRNMEAKNLSLVCDQKGRNTFDKPTIFLNQKVDNFHSSPAVLSKELDLPIYFVFCKYDFDNVCFSHKIEKLEILPEECSHEITQKIATRFAEEILSHPEQYLWAHNRFNI